ncbi:hypothetical protein ABRD05_16100 [Bacillus velezensis]
MVKLLKINKLEEMIKYEDPNTSNVHHGGKQWTRGVPIVLVTKEDRAFAINEWVYINNNGELVYNKKRIYGVKDGTGMTKVNRILKKFL